MKGEHRYPKLVAVKLDARTAEALRRLARADDRTLSAYLRRMIVKETAGGEASR